MTNLVYQVYLGEPDSLYDFCTKSVQKYCAKYGIDYKIQREPILKITPDLSVTNRSIPSYSRLGYLPIYEKENAFSFLSEYDNIAIIDADIYIRENAPNIFEHFSGDFGAVVERDMPITHGYKHKIINYSKEQYQTLADIDWKVDHRGHEFMNMGLMLCSSNLSKYLRGQSPHDFLRRPEFKRFVDGIGLWKWSTDQTLLNYWIRKEQMSIHRMDWKWNALYKAIDDNKLKEAYFIHFFLKDHLPNKGANIDTLIRNLKLI